MSATMDPFSGLDPDMEDELGQFAEPEIKEPQTVEGILVSCGFSALLKESSIDQIVASLKLLAIKIMELDKLQRAAIREECVKRLQQIDVRSPAALVDAAFFNDGLVAADNPIAVVEPLPWPDSVDGAELLEDIASIFSKYISLPAEDATVLALWTALTYLSDHFFVLPMLVITSPEKRCGKTLVMELLQGLCLRAIPASNISAASIFRIVERYHPTLLIDEADTFLGEYEELKGIINSGHRRSFAFVVRCEGDQNEPKKFSTWCPKAIALIGSIADTLEDRSIHIEMKRKTDEDEIAPLRSDRIAGELDPLRRKLARWTRDNNHVGGLDPAVPDNLNDRAKDNWRPLIAIAEVAGGMWPALAKESASIRVDNDDDSVGVQLLADIRVLSEIQRFTRISSEQLQEYLKGMSDRPWADWSKGRPISQRGIARLLKPFGIASKQIRIGEFNGRGYEMEDFQDAFSRY
jgi:putative DNA primase/helicase